MSLCGFLETAGCEARGAGWNHVGVSSRTDFPVVVAEDSEGVIGCSWAAASHLSKREVGAVGKVEAERWWVGEFWSKDRRFCNCSGIFGDWDGVLGYFEGGHYDGYVLTGRGHCWWGCLEVDVYLRKDVLK